MTEHVASHRLFFARDEALPNIGPGVRRHRLLQGVTMLMMGIGVALMLFGLRAGPYFRLLVFVPLWLGALGLLQWRAHTCVGLAERGERDLGSGPEPIADPAARARVKRQADVIARTALVFAGLGTLATLVIRAA